MAAASCRHMPNVFPHAAKWVICWWDQFMESCRTPQCTEYKNSCSKHDDKSPQNTSEKNIKADFGPIQERYSCCLVVLGHSPGPQQPFDCRNSFESCSQYECILRERGRWVDDASLNLTLIKNTKCDGCGVCVGVQCVGVQGDW